MKALRLYAGPQARQHIEQHGLRPQHVRVVPGWLDKGLKWRHSATHFLDNMEQQGLKPKDLEPMIGQRNRV